MKATLTAVMLAVLVAAAGEIRINSLDVEADRAVSVTGQQSNQLARAAAAAGYAYSPTNPPPAAGNVVSVNGATGVVSVTLAQAAAAGGFAGTEEIGPLRVNAKMFGESAGEGASGDYWGAFGRNAGFGASGNYWGAFGHSAGLGAVGGEWGAYGPGAGGNAVGDEWGAYGGGAGSNASGNFWGAYGGGAGNSASGNFWGAYGGGAGNSASGDYWGAYGYRAGKGAIWTNSHALGRFAGRSSRGDNRLYVDTYSADPEYPADGSTNDVIFSDNGRLHLGRGAGAPGGAQGGTLRGPWRTDAGLSVTGSFTVNGDNLASRTNEWRRIPWGALDATSLISAHQTLRSTGASGASVSGVSVCESLCLYRADFVNNSSSTNIAVIAQRANYAGALTGPAHTNAITVSGAYVSVLFALPAAESSEYDFVRIRYENAGGGTLSNFLYFRAFYERRATASETDAYAAGWRP